MLQARLSEFPKHSAVSLINSAVFNQQSKRSAELPSAGHSHTMWIVWIALNWAEL